MLTWNASLVCAAAVAARAAITNAIAKGPLIGFPSRRSVAPGGEPLNYPIGVAGGVFTACLLTRDSLAFIRIVFFPDESEDILGDVKRRTSGARARSLRGNRRGR